ncbi:MAG: hypothetical protein AB1Z29_00025 [Desulfobacterales bacterium]
MNLNNLGGLGVLALCSIQKTEVRGQKAQSKGRIYLKPYKRRSDTCWKYET